MAVRESKLIVALVDKLTGPSRAVSSALGRLNAMAATNAARLDAARGSMLDAVGMGYALAESLGAPIKAAIEFESSISDLTKVMDFSSPAALKDMTKDIREMSLRIPIAASGIADIAAAAAGAGIKENELTKFTELAAKVSTAWDTTAGETGKDLAKLKSGLGLTLDETGLLADAINHLSNNSSAAAPEILKVVKSTATTAKQFGFTAEQTAAFGTAMVSSGFEADVAATSFLNAGRALTKGASATPRVNAAFKKLGLTAKGTAKSMQKDAMGTFVDVLQRINKLPAEMRASTVSDLFGDEARALGPLITNGQMLADVLGLISDQNKYAGSASKEFDAAAKRTANALKLFRNRVNDLAISVGDALLPALNKVLEVVGPTITNISRLAQEYPGLTAAITGTVSALIALRIAATALRFAGLFAFGSVLSAGIGALGGASAILTGVSGGLTALGAAIAAVSAPALLAIGVGLAAIGAAGAYLWAKWDRISSIVTGVARAIGDELKPVVELIQPVLDHFAPSFEAIGDAANWAWTQIKEVSSWLGGLFGKEDLTRQHEMAIEDGAYAITRKIIAAFKAANAAIFAAGAEMVQALWDGMLSKVDALIEWVKTIPQRIKAAIGDIDFLGGIKAKLGLGGGSSEPAVDGARAKGGPVGAGKTYLVGENGPEIFSPGRSGVISTNDAFQAAQAGAAARSAPVKAGDTYINVNVPAINVSGVSDPRTAAQVTVAELGGAIKSAVEAADTD
ncbi:phage tail tape measure protein [Shinella sp. 838]|uniref:phage tail tape measure protein n=1 Tax=Shinella sp. 838 TaxID=3038164 RepID=UPI0024150216|nr:phage tail tape measure protein [Shinella sp. 838]MDG4671626.1 phage tail tape measure protein [Shinella sp. 838]